MEITKGDHNMTNNTKTIAILESNGDAFTVIYVDTDPIVSDNPDVDSLDLLNWAIEKHATNDAAVIDVVFFDSDTAARKWGKTYEQFTTNI
jgi:hypothetical protein